MQPTLKVGSERFQIRNTISTDFRYIHRISFHQPPFLHLQTLEHVFAAGNSPVGHPLDLQTFKKTEESHSKFDVNMTTQYTSRKVPWKNKELENKCSNYLSIPIKKPRSPPAMWRCCWARTSSTLRGLGTWNDDYLF